MNARRTSCTEVDEKLPLYVGGDLDVDALEAVREHLASCEVCARRAGEATRAREALRVALAREAETLRPNLWPGIRAVLRAEELVREDRPLGAPIHVGHVGQRGHAARVGRTGAKPRLLRVAAPLAAAAALVATLTLGGTLGGLWPRGETGETGPGEIPGPLAERFELPVEDAGTVLVTPVSNGLRRVAPGEEDLFQGASELRRARTAPRGQPVGSDALLPGLAGYR